MADQANERLKALKASIKEALGKLTGSDELEAQGARERAGGAVVDRKTKARVATPTTKKARRDPKARSPRRPS